MGTQRRNNMMIGDAIVKKTKADEEPDKVKANGGYNGFKTAKDLLQIDFKDDKSDSSDSEVVEHKVIKLLFFACRTQYAYVPCIIVSCSRLKVDSTLSALCCS